MGVSALGARGGCPRAAASIVYLLLLYYYRGVRVGRRRRRVHYYQSGPQTSLAIIFRLNNISRRTAPRPAGRPSARNVMAARGHFACTPAAGRPNLHNKRRKICDALTRYCHDTERRRYGATTERVFVRGRCRPLRGTGCLQVTVLFRFHVGSTTRETIVPS